MRLSSLRAVAAGPSAAGPAWRCAPPAARAHGPVALARRRVGASAGKKDKDPSAAVPLKPPHPGYQEEHDVSHEAFMRAFKGSHPVAASVPGLQEYAAALLHRRRYIPSSAKAGVDPLDHMFAEADRDGDGVLSAAEVAAALRSRGVGASADVVGRFVRCARDASGASPPPGPPSSETIKRGEFAAFVLAMASADMHHHGPAAKASSGGGGAGGKGGGSAPP